MNPGNRNIAIDGDSGSGKSTVGRSVASKLRFDFIDSGLFYRAATLAIILSGNAENPKKWVETMNNTEIEYENGKVIINGEETNIDKLRSREVDNLVSPVSTVPEIRSIITEMLRKVANKKNVVMVGRDIGSVVLKDAFLKIYLTATLEERANRRFKELVGKGIKTTFEEVLENLKNRDLIDSTRKTAPLVIPKDAYVIDTTEIGIEEVVKKIMDFYEAKEYAIRNNALHSKSSV